MKMPWISIAGLIEEEPTLFANLVLPTAADYADISDLVVDHPFVPDKTVLTNYMLMQLAELPVVYSDPAVLKVLIGYWSAAQLPTWVDVWRTMLYNYNPIWNKDGTVKERHDTAFNNTSSGTNTGTVGRSGSSSGSTENQVTGYDTNAYSPNKKDISSGSASETVTNNLADSHAEGGTAFDVMERTETGNIGVTTTQQMIKEQREIALNFYDMICQAFKKQFCVMVW